MGLAARSPLITSRQNASHHLSRETAKRDGIPIPVKVWSARTRDGIGVVAFIAVHIEPVGYRDLLTIRQDGDPEFSVYGVNIQLNHAR